MFYNTTGLFGEPLQEAEKRAESLDGEIYDVFKKYPGLKLGASNVHEIILKDRGVDFGPKSKTFNSYRTAMKKINNPPITSVRRSINTLLKDGKITEVGEHKGVYGMRELTYQLK